nr:hypothetical protein [Tanacetum cinerariifolium]
RAMVTASTDGKLPLYERCFIRHVVQCMIKCHKCRKVKQEEVREARGRAYAIKEAEPQGSDRSFMDIRFSVMLDIDLIKIGSIYEVELADGQGEVTSFKLDDLNEVVRMAHKLMEQKSKARDARILEGMKRKWESLQGGNSSGKGNQRDNSRHTL